MGNCCPNALIVIGIFILLISGILTIGFNSIVKTAVPIAVKFLPLNSTLQLWIEIPLALDIKAIFTNVSTTNEITNNTLALGQLGFRVEMAAWTDESDGVFPIVWMEEEGRVEILQRYFLLLSEGAFNYAKYYSWTFALLTFVVATIGGIMALKTRNS